MKKTYQGWQEWNYRSRQTEVTAPTPLLAEDGTLFARGWARKNVFLYDRDRVKHVMRRKEWDFYQISDGHYMAQISFANISLGGYASAVLVDLQEGKTLVSSMAPFVGGKDRYILPPRGDEPNYVSFRVGNALFEADTTDTGRTLRYENGEIHCEFQMDIMPGLENITTVLPFSGHPDRYFMTTKQNCMPCSGTVRAPGISVAFSKENAFGILDWGRVCTPYSLVWYWGNGSGWLRDAAGEKHLFGFEITWGIGNEANATETCVFYDGKAHKIGAVDVEVFPKPDRYMEPWKFVSEDGRFNLTMQPFYDHHSDLNVFAMRMHSHQVHGLWNGTVVLDDGQVLGIHDLYAFCEYVENRW